MGLLEQLGGELVKSITIESALLAPITVVPFPSGAAPSTGEGEGSSGPSWVLRFLKPRITVAGPYPMIIAPAGDPPLVPWVGWALVGGLAIISALALVGIVSLVKGR